MALPVRLLGDQTITLEEARGYLIKVGEQAIISYDLGLFDASSVMIRKLLEILIIELFEKNKVESHIKNADVDYFYLEELISKLLNENGKSWNLSKNSRNSLPRIKRIGDLSAHSRMFVAKKTDINKISQDLRIVIEELIHLTDYNNWNNK